MKNKFVLFTVLLALALFSAACMTQDATNEPAEVTAMPTVSTEGDAATEEAAMTPTGATESDTPATEAGATASIPQTGLGSVGAPDDLEEVLRVLRETGATLESGDTVETDFVSVPGQIININGEEVQFFTYDSAEALEIEASQLANEADPESEPRYYKLGNMLVYYAGSDPGVRDLLEDVLGAQAAGQ